MKRKLAGLLTALMVLAMGTTAFAAGSPNSESNSGTTSTTPSTSQEPVIGNATNTTITKVSDAVAAAAENVAKQISPNAQVEAVVDVTFNGEIPAGGVQISFSLPNVQAGDNYVLLHQLADGRWEKITPDSIENGIIKATFTSLSPVAFVKIAPAQNGGSTGTDGTSANPNGTTTGTSNTAAGTVAASPKTGAALPVLPVLAMICAAGIVVCGRKVKFND